jgi:cobalt-zinc-cadmium efflux system membrane fusion protein
MKCEIGAIVAAILIGTAGGCSRPKPAQDSPNTGAGAAAVVSISAVSQRAAEITVAPATSGSIPVVISAVGALALNEQTTDRIGVVFSGTVIKIFANVGDHVRAGQVLALMHSHDLHDAIAAYQSAAADANRANVQVGYAITVRNRYRRLYEFQYASREEAERSEMQYRSAAADYEKATAELRAARAHLAGMLQVPERGIEGLNIDADSIPIKTPREGIVISRTVTPGMALQPGMETFTVSDLSSLWMIASVSERDIRFVQIGLPASLRVHAFPKQIFSGEVDQIGPQLDPITRTLSVRIVIPNRDLRLRPDMFGSAEIAEGGSRIAIFVRDASVQDMNGNPVVFIRRGSTAFEARPVELGARREGQVEIRNGVIAGEMVVNHGAFVVKSEFLTRAFSQD